jgi:NAD(P)H dehydrogenase (quinone)
MRDLPPAGRMLSRRGALQTNDAFLFCIPIRYRNFPVQWKAFWDLPGCQWATGGFLGKYAGIFVSIGNQGGGQEITVVNAISTLTHHGISMFL